MEYICSVDHRSFQNVVRTKDWHLIFFNPLDIFCDLLVNGHMETWDLFVLHLMKQNLVNDEAINQPKCCNPGYIV